MTEPSKDDLILPILEKLVEIVERTEKFVKDHNALVQQQLAVIEAQLNTTTLWASRSFNSTLDPAARAAVLQDAKAAADEIAKKFQEEEELMLLARQARGIGNGGDAVTPQDIEWYRNGSD